MSPPSGASQLLDRLGSYNALHDRSEPIRFADLAKEAPFFEGPNEGLKSIGVASFARLAYCPYTVWHNIRRTSEVRPPKAEIAVNKGKEVHAAREVAALKVVAKAKAATRRQLRDPRVDLVELPEFPGCFRREGWLYRARLDGLSRHDGNLVVHELKTGRYAGMPDQMLQVWAYCMASPGAMMKLTDGSLRANGVSWVIEYPSLGETWGPFRFRTAQLQLLGEAMAFYESTGLASITDDNLNLDWRSYPAKCAPCGFAHACQWRVEARRKIDVPRPPSVTLDDYLESRTRKGQPDGSSRSRRHGNHGTRKVQ